MSMHLMGVYLMGVHLTGVYLIGTYGRASHGRAYLLQACREAVDTPHVNSPSPELALEFAPLIHPGASVIWTYHPSKERPFLERFRHTRLWAKLSSKNGRCCQEGDRGVFAVARSENSHRRGCGCRPKLYRKVSRLVLAGHVIRPPCRCWSEVGALPDRVGSRLIEKGAFLG